MVEFRRVDWSGHVYNLRTVEGFYLANGIVTHNCDCGVEPLYGKHPGGLSVPADVVRVVQDHEIGPRLMAEGWAA